MPLHHLPKDVNDAIIDLVAAWSIYNEAMQEEAPKQPLVDTARRNIQERKRELIHVLTAESL